jgi:hypothetical protein
MVWLFLFLALWFTFALFLLSFENTYDEVGPVERIAVAAVLGALFWTIGFVLYHTAMAFWLYAVG